MANKAIVDLGYKPRAWQLKFHRNKKRYNVLKVHRRGGKTVAAVMELVLAAAKCTRELGRFAYIAPTLVQAKAIAWEYIKAKARLIPGTKINEAECWVELPNGARIRVYGADNPDSLRGLYFDGVVLDEVALMEPMMWGEIIRPAIGDRGGWALFMGTPKGITLLSQLFNAAQNKEDWYAAAFTVHDTGAMLPKSEQPDENSLHLEEVETMRSEMTEAQFAQEMLCDDNAGNENSLLSVYDAEEAFNRDIQERDYCFDAKIIGADIARSGVDKSTVWFRQGRFAKLMAVYQGQDTMTTASAISAIAKEVGAESINIDAGGIGAGVVDRLRQLGWKNVVDVQFGGNSVDDRYKNQRAYMHFKAAEWVKTGGCIQKHPKWTDRIKIEMCAPQYHHKNPKGQFQIESKDEIKTRIGFSPDLYDGLITTFAVEVLPMPKRDRIMEMSGKDSVKIYDPFYDIKLQDNTYNPLAF